MKLSKSFFTSKTTWLGAAAILQAVISHYTGGITLEQMGVAIYAALAGVFLRDTMAKNTEAVQKAGENQHGTR